jgi:hypothetical protein
MKDILWLVVVVLLWTLDFNALAAFMLGVFWAGFWQGFLAEIRIRFSDKREEGR